MHRRNLGLVFQSYALFPHMTVFENVAFGLRRRGVARPSWARASSGCSSWCGSARSARAHPRELSGGQQQRVALARALVTEPRVLLLDEPLSNLDALLRDEMRVELKRLQERLGTTMIFVTHDQAEALILSDRVVVMEAGRVEQIGRPEEVYRRPATAFVARFLGRANFLAGTVAETGRDRHRRRARWRRALGRGRSARRDWCRGQPVQRGDPPGEHPPRAPRGGRGSAPTSFAATIVFHAFAGQAHHYVIQLADGRELEVAAPGATPPLARGSRHASGVEPGRRDRAARRRGGRGEDAREARTRLAARSRRRCCCSSSRSSCRWG